MNAFSEQLSAARKSQFDAQLEFARTVTAQAFAAAEQVLALNISASRAQVERTASTLRRLMSISDPRDLFTLGSTSQEQLASMLEYGRELFNIVTDARLNLSRSAGEVPAPQPETEQAAAPAAPAEPQQKAPAKPVAVADGQAAAEPPAQAKPIAKAVRKVAGKRGAAKPSASPIAIEAVLDPKPLVDAAAAVQLKPATARKAPRKK